MEAMIVAQKQPAGYRIFHSHPHFLSTQKVVEQEIWNSGGRHPNSHVTQAMHLPAPAASGRDSSRTPVTA